VAVGLVRLFSQVNRTLNVIVFTDEFEAEIEGLTAENGRLRNEIMQTKRYQRISELLDKRGGKPA